MQKVQIESVSLEELLQGIRSVVVPDQHTIKPAKADSVMITVLNKKDAANTLNISQSLFTKLQYKGIIPPTVRAGLNNKGEIIERWAQHHLILIKPIIQKLRHQQTAQAYVDAKKSVREILGV
jgi:ribosome biogenesis GTPase A